MDLSHLLWLLEIPNLMLGKINTTEDVLQESDIIRIVTIGLLLIWDHSK